MDALGPFEPEPSLAVAVSGGADSMALAVLTDDWVRGRGGSTMALVVDHGLRPESADEARICIERLADLGIAAMLLRLSELRAGPGVAERARTARYQVLTDACRRLGILHLLLGHHAADQVETLVMRVLRGSQTHGMAGMSALLDTAGPRLLRPMLGIEPSLLRGLLEDRGIGWIEDPSNRDLRATRPRLRHRLAAVAPGDCGLTAAIASVAGLRSREEAWAAAELARRAAVRPEGFALLSPGPISSAALSSLLRVIGGAAYPAGSGRVNALAAWPKPATVAGVRIVQSGRSGQGLLVVREENGVMEPVEARDGAVWDNRFRIVGRAGCPDGATIGKLGDDAARFRGVSALPSVVLRTLPAIRCGKSLVAVPHLSYAANGDVATVRVLFTPPRPLAGLCFVPAP